MTLRKRRAQGTLCPIFPDDLSTLKQIIQANPSGIVLVDALCPDLPVVYVNDAFEQNTGYTREEVQGKNCRFLHQGDPDQPGLDDIRKGIAAQETCMAVLRNYRKDGSLFWNEIRISPIRDKQGEVTYFIGVQNDITARVEAEAALAVSEQRYREIFDSKYAIKLLIDMRTGIICDASEAAYRFYGYTVQQLKTMHIWDLNTMPEEMVLQTMHQAYAREQNFFEFRHRLASGETRDVDVFCSPVEMMEGEYLYSIIVDSTDKREAELRYHSLFNQSNDAVFILDLSGRHMQVNQRAAELFGYSVDEIVGMTYHDLVVQEEHHQSDVVLERLMKGERVSLYERTFRHKNGHTLQAEISVDIVRNRDGTPRYIQSIVRDISRRKRLEAANRAFLDDMKALQRLHLELSAIENLQTLFYHMIDLSHTRLNLDRVVLFVLNSAGSQLLGTYGTDPSGQIRDESYFHETIVPGHWTEQVLNAPNHARVWYDDDLYDNGQKVGRGWKAASALWNGSRAIGYLICDNFISRREPRSYEAELISILGSTFGHLLERKQMEMSIRQSEERLRVMFQALPDLIFRNRADGTYLDYHAPDPSLLFEVPEQFMGRKIEEVLPAATAEAQMADIQQAIDTGQVIMREVVLSIMDKVRHFEVRVVPSGDEEVLSITRDITDIREAQKRQLELALEKERVHLLSTFIQNAAHEFRTPLATISMGAQLMARMDDPARRQMKAGQLLEQVNQTTKLLDMLLVMVKLEIDGAVKRSPLNIQGTLDAVRVNMISRYGDKHTLRYEVPSDLPQIDGDATYLTEAFLQIFDNAYRYTPDGGTVTLTAEATDDALIVTIGDTGPGIATDVLPQIFDTFWRHDEAHSTPGFGLGLSIAQKVIQKHGGQLGVESLIGQGTTFTVSLPLVAHQ